jgi:hypothetical protein
MNNLRNKSTQQFVGSQAVSRANQSANWMLQPQSKNKIACHSSVISRLSQKACFAVTPTMFLAGALMTNMSAANAATIDRIEPGIRAMAMSGAFVAQADDSSAIWYNPAGLAHLAGDSEPHGEFTTVYGNSSDSSKDATDEGEQLSVLWARGGSTLAFALGLYDTQAINITLPAAAGSDSERLTLESYDLSMGLAMAYKNLLLGVKLAVTSLAPSEESTYEDLDESTFNWQVGAQYRFVNEYFDIFDTSALVELDVGANYRAEAKVTVFDPLIRHPYKLTEFTAYPESLSAGIHTGLGWISEMLIWKLNFNFDQEMATYSNMAPFMVDAQVPGDIQLSRTAMGGELLLSQDKSNWQLSLRGGVAEQISDFDDFNETVLSAGVGVKFMRTSFEVAVQRSEPAEKSTSLPREAVSAGISFTW